MKNILIFAGLAGLAAAIAIYFVSEDLKSGGEYLSDGEIEDYDFLEYNGEPLQPRAFNAMG